jgi:hypothetical protein
VGRAGIPTLPPRLPGRKASPAESCAKEKKWNAVPKGTRKHFESSWKASRKRREKFSCIFNEAVLLCLIVTPLLESES